MNPASSIPRSLAEAFVARTGQQPRLFRAPGRVNLIGEHTDYNDGFVLPMAIEWACYVAAAPRSDSLVIAESLNAEGEIRVDLEAGSAEPSAEGWGRFLEGMVRGLQREGVRLRGARLLVSSDIPSGAGLSSSAALEVALGLALLDVGAQSLPPRVLALTGQWAEHHYVGTQCGIMDPLISALAQQHHALLIDCRSLEATAIPCDFGSHVLLVCDSRVRHSLASSEYNVRRAQCEEGVAALGRKFPQVKSLRDVSAKMLEEVALAEPIARRCRHVVSENERTQQAAAALSSGRLEELGTLMTQSHWSLAGDYQVSCSELDVIVEAALKVPGCLGARMTGGGFGGCVLALCRAEVAPELEAQVTRAFLAAFGHAPGFFVTQASSGAGPISLG